MENLDKMAKILVIDDEQLHRDHAAKILRDAGYEVLVAEGGEQGLRRIAESMPDLVLCDAVMPEVDGFAVLERLRADPKSRAVPFAIFTAMRVKGVRSEAKQQGAQDFLNKPYKAEEQLAMVQRLLGEVDSAGPAR